MNADSKIHRIALSQVAFNLSLGIIPLILFAVFLPNVGLSKSMGLWICLAVSMLIHLLFSIGLRAEVMNRNYGFIRIISCLLLGSSLIAIFWKWQNLPHAFEIIILSFSIRWLLFFVETWKLKIADQRREPLPSLATRIRRIITFITGAIIPGMILMGLPAIPLLSISFTLTAFSQWAIACESYYHLGLNTRKGDQCPAQ
jgi:hypothetical protein